MITDFVIKTYVDGGENDTIFIDSDNPIEVGQYTYTAQRMGAVPTVTATILSFTCLDSYWTKKQYITVNGDKFFVFNTPSSAKQQTDGRYTHTVTFYSERYELNGIYFFDVVENDSSLFGGYFSNSTTINTYCDIEEFAARLQMSLNYCEVNYTVIVDDNISTDAVAVSFEDTYIMDALQESYSLFDVPYYFNGREIHFGYAENNLTQIFKQGDSLLEINKTNANYKEVAYCTGIGSEDNIPYYYPNERDVNVDKVQIPIEIETDFNSVCSSLGIDAVTNDTYTVTTNLTAVNISGETSLILTELKEYVQVIGSVQVQDNGDINITRTSESIYNSSTDTEKIVLAVGEIVGTRPTAYTTVAQKTIYDKQNNITLGNSGSLTATNIANGVYDIFVILSPCYYTGSSGYPSFGYKLNSGTVTSYRYESYVFDTSTIVDYVTDVLIPNNQSHSTELNAFITRTEVRLNELATSTNALPFMANLMPPKFRDTYGDERFYPAVNNTYKIPNENEYYSFENLYADSIIKEQMVVEFEDIKPTIEGMTNADGYLMGEVLAFAYDDNDNDDFVYDDTGSPLDEYAHSYFYMKLRKFDGDNGFDLFSCATEDDTMKIVMSSGNCNGIEFEVQSIQSEVNGAYVFYNPVQVDDNGDIVAGDAEDKINQTSFQDRQQNTQTNEIWIALKKTLNYNNIIMPNATYSVKPNAGDTFVITSISLPHGYVTAAEERLEEAIIKYMWENNVPKFTFTLKFSRIFFGENPTILANLNENSTITFEYDGVEYNSYVSTFSYKSPTNAIPLPEVTVTLSETLSTQTGTLQNTISEVKTDILSSISNNIDILKLALPYFLRKDTEDLAKEKIKFRKGIYSEDWKEGGFTGQGWCAYTKDDGSSIAEFDEIFVRKTATFNELIINQISFTLGQTVFTNGGFEITEVEEEELFYRCYYDNKDGNRMAGIVVGDFVRCQEYDSSYASIIRYYSRLVVATTTDTVCLSKEVFDGIGTPQIGDNCVQWGNYSDTDRQFALIRNVTGGGYDQFLWGINTVSSVGTEYYFVGVQTDNIPRFQFGNENIGGIRSLLNFTTDDDGNVVPKVTLDIWANSFSIQKPTGEYENVSDQISQAQTDATQAIADAQAAIDAASATQENVNVLSDSFTLYQGEVSDKFDEQRTLIDGEISTWKLGKTLGEYADLYSSFGYVSTDLSEFPPTATSFPAAMWSTDALKKTHELDSYLCVDSDNQYYMKAWRYVESSGTYSWNLLSDSENAQLFALIGTAQTTADGKTTNYLSQPTSYSAGDTWTLASDATINSVSYLAGDVLTTSTTSSVYLASHWSKLIRYTDDTAANEVQNNLDNLAFSSTNLLDYLTSSGDSSWTGSSATLTITDGVIRGTAISTSYPRIINTSVNNLTFDTSSEYTLQFEVRGNIAETRTLAIIATASSTEILKPSIQISVTTEWRTITQVFTPNYESTESTITLQFYCSKNPYTVGDWTELRNVMLVKGNKIDGSWSPSYNDIKGVSIENSDVEYAQSSSSTEVPTTGWDTDAPTWVSGMYIWQRIRTTYIDGTTYTANAICITGEKGATGTSVTIDDTTVTYAQSTSGTTAPTSWSDTIPTMTAGNYLWTKTVVDYSSGDDTVSYSVSRWGVDGATGANGESITISDYSITYNRHTSGTSEPTDSWTTTIPEVGEGEFLWTRTIVTYSDGVSTTAYSVSRQGVDGVGTDGRGIETITNYYLASSLSSGVTTNTSGWTTGVQTATATAPFLWNFERIAFDDNTSSDTTPSIIGNYASDGKGISSIVEYYAINNSTTAPTTGFSTSVATPTSTNRYLWNYEVINYTTGDPTTTSKRIIGVYGDTGESGLGIESIVEEYAISTSKTTAPTTGWSTTAPTWESNYYLWYRSTVTYDDGTTAVVGTSVDTAWEAANDVQTNLDNLVIGGNNLYSTGDFYREMISSSKATTYDTTLTETDDGVVLQYSIATAYYTAGTTTVHKYASDIFETDAQYTFYAELYGAGSYTGTSSTVYRNAGFHITYTDGTRTSTLISSTETWTAKTVISTEGKTISYLNISYDGSGTVSVSNLRIYKGVKDLGNNYSLNDTNILISEADAKGQAYLDELSGYDDDGVITPTEKVAYQNKWKTIYSEYSGYISSANTYNVSTTDYTTTYNSLNSYLNGSSGLLSDMASTVSVNVNTVDGYFTSYYSALSTLSANMQIAIDNLAQGYVDNLTIGTENLLSNSGDLPREITSDTGTGTYYSWEVLPDETLFGNKIVRYTKIGTGRPGQYPQNVSLTEGKTYTHTIWIRCTDYSSTTYPIVRFYQSSTQSSTGNARFWKDAYLPSSMADGEWHAFSVTLECTESGTYQLLAYINGDAGLVTDICSQMLVEGSKSVTVWTENQDDLTSILAEAYDNQLENSVTRSFQFRGYGDEKDISSALLTSTQYTFSIDSADLDNGDNYLIVVRRTTSPYTIIASSNFNKDTKSSLTFTTPSTYEYKIYVVEAIHTYGNECTSGTLHYLMLQKYNKATEWKPENKILSTAMQGTTEILGGLILSNIIALTDTSGVVTAGLNGLSDSNVGLWLGGSISEADAGNAITQLNLDGSGHFASKKIQWTSSGGLEVGVFEVEDDYVAISAGSRKIYLTTKTSDEIPLGLFSGSLTFSSSSYARVDYGYSIQSSTLDASAINGNIQITISTINTSLKITYGGSSPYPQDFYLGIGLFKNDSLWYVLASDTISISASDTGITKYATIYAAAKTISTALYGTNSLQVKTWCNSTTDNENGYLAYLKTNTATTIEINSVNYNTILASDGLILTQGGASKFLVTSGDDDMLNLEFAGDIGGTQGTLSVVNGYLKLT